MARINVFVFGLDRAGKTTLVTYFQEKKFIPQSPTIGVNISHLIFAGSDLTMEFTDVGGQKRFRNDWENYIKRPHVLVFVIDASDRNEDRIQDGRVELQKLLANPKVTGIPLLVLINKVDLDMVMQREIVEKKFGLGKITGREVMIYEVSAMTGKNVDAVINALTTLVLKDEGVEYFVNQQVKAQSKELLDRYKKFYAAGIEAHAKGNLDQALASLNLAREIAANLFQLGVLSQGKEYQKLGTMIAKVERAITEAEERRADHGPGRPARNGNRAGPGFPADTTGDAATALQAPVIPAFAPKPPAFELPPKPAAKRATVKDVTCFVSGTDATGMQLVVDYFASGRFQREDITYSIDVPDILLDNVGFTFNDLPTREVLEGNVLATWNDPDVIFFVVDALDDASFPLARRIILSTLQRWETRGATAIIIVNNFDATGSQPQAFIDKITDVKKLPGITAGIFEVSLKHAYNMEELLNFLVSHLMRDKVVQQFVSKKMDAMLDNYKEMYKALVKEAHAMEKQKDFQGAFNRIAKAKLVQEELFKNNLPNAQKEIKKCDEWLSKLRLTSLKGS